MERGWFHGEEFLLCLILHLLLQGRGDTFTINCSGFDQHGVDPAAFQIGFNRKAFRPAINDSILTHVNISFTPSAILEVVAIRRRPSLYVINLLVPSSFLVAIDALSFYLPAESENQAPFKTTLLLGYVFLLTMNDLLPATGTPLISVKQPVELVGKVPGPREAEFSGCPGSGRAQQEDKAQKQRLVGLWVQFSHVMDTLLFCLYLLFQATSVIIVIIPWNTKANIHSHRSLQTTAWSFF
ncbi:hypothetical protein MC885_014568 [Smutsia gigantea]|nr:hypothetical protein MC885_014568 [Smutsia gigantea]